MPPQFGHSDVGFLGLRALSARLLALVALRPHDNARLTDLRCSSAVLGSAHASATLSVTERLGKLLDRSANARSQEATPTWPRARTPFAKKSWAMPREENVSAPLALETMKEARKGCTNIVNMHINCV